MWSYSRGVTLFLATAVTVVGAAIASSSANDNNFAAEQAVVSARRSANLSHKSTKTARPARNALPSKLLEGFDPLRHKKVGENLVSDQKTARALCSVWIRIYKSGSRRC